MKQLFSAELLKLRTTRAFYVATFVALAFATALPFVVGALAGSGDVDELTAGSLLDVVRAPVQVAGGAVLLIGLLASAGEYRHRTVLLSRLAEPRTGRALVAKLGAVAAVGLAVGVAMDALSLIAGGLVLHRAGLPVEPLSHGVPRAAVLVPVSLALYGIFGLAVGAIVRSTAGAVGAVLVWAFVVEGALPLVLNEPHLGDRLPSAALVAMVRGGAELPSTTAGVLGVAYAVVLVAAAAAMERWREL